MKPIIMLKTLFYPVILLLTLNSIVVSQCEGVYFKAVKAKFLAGRITFENTANKDLTGDGKTDLIGYRYADNSFNIEKIIILPNDGQGGFDSPLQEIPVPVSPASISITVADYNSDGRNDLIVSIGSFPSTVIIYRNNGNGSFTQLTTFSLSNFEIFLNVVDINNDGIIDLLTLINTPNNELNFYYRFGNANGTFGSQVQTPAALYTIPGDFNNDGKIDFPVVSGSSPNYQLRIYYNQGNGVFTLGSNVTNIGSVYPAFAREFNNDGKIDLLADSYPNLVSVIKNLGNDNFSKTEYSLPPIRNTTPSGNPPKFGDFNGDGFLDFVTVSEAKPFYSIYTNDGSANFSRRDYNQPLNGAYIENIDGDNKTDLVRINRFNLFPQSIGPTLFNETRITVMKNVCDNPGQTKLVDFDGDSISDKTLWRAGDGRWLYHQSLYPSPFSAFYWGSNGDKTTPGDYDGDGITDFAVYRPSEGTWYIRKSSDGSYLFKQFGLGEDKPVASDYDGDGRTDIAIYRPSTGNWYVFNSRTQQVTGAHFGIGEDVPLPEDYDGDGKSDLAVFRPSNGFWYLLKSSDGSFLPTQWGNNTDKPVPGDYDGDLKADLTVFRESEGIWYILRSYNGQLAAFRFGSAGDIPQPGDWDGNGILDLGVYRPSTNNWYSSDTNAQFTFGSSNENPNSYILRIE